MSSTGSKIRAALQEFLDYACATGGADEIPGLERALEIVDEVSSGTNQVGERGEIEMTTACVFCGGVLDPAGAAAIPEREMFESKTGETFLERETGRYAHDSCVARKLEARAGAKGEGGEHEWGA